MGLPQNNRRILIFEPNVDGHHVGWLRFITEDLLSAGFLLTLALDTHPDAMKRIEDQMADLLPSVKVISAFSVGEAKSKFISSARVAACLKQSNAKLAFLAQFNDIASAMFRRVSLGLMPDKALRGRLGGIYFRPLFLSASPLSPNQALKKIGFRRLVTGGWLNPLLMIDPLLCNIAKKKYPVAPIYPLADPYPENFHADRSMSRRKFHLPDDKFVFLFYGGGYKRKGLHLVVAAMRGMTAPNNAFLLCAGLQPKNEQLGGELSILRAEGRAEVVNRYVTAEEEKQLFAACDAVLLPYIRHPVGSGVLSRAAGAGKPVVASDEYFLGHVVRQYGMGLLFPSGDVPELRNAIIRAVSAVDEELSRWQTSAQTYAETCSRAVFRTSLVAAIERAVAANNDFRFCS
ncbi:MAG TPA: glycosyltransferase [Candidatus Saccharimonadales bacterium]|nr:glycosyltransferase [Candidatus Saccharimonadales bacterium]